jgi:hypothetical protein
MHINSFLRRKPVEVEEFGLLSLLYLIENKKSMELVREEKCLLSSNKERKAEMEGPSAKSYRVLASSNMPTC